MFGLAPLRPMVGTVHVDMGVRTTEVVVDEHVRLCRNRNIMMQPQQQTVVTSSAQVQPVYISQTAAVVTSYRNRQSTVIGILLIIAGALSIIFNIVDIAVGTRHASTTGYTVIYRGISYSTLSHLSNGYVFHGFWCGGVMVSILLFKKY